MEIIIGVGCAFVLILFLLILFVVWYKRNLKSKYGLYLVPNEEFVVSVRLALHRSSSICS